MASPPTANLYHLSSRAPEMRDTCTTCGGPLVAIRSTRKHCSPSCRTRAYRHRRAIGPVKLRECTVEPIPKAEAAPLILRHEHLGTLGQCRLFYGLRAPGGRLIGAVGFGRGAHNAGADVTLERGCCVPGAPPNAASYLIARALRQGCRDLGWRAVKAFSDPRFGETGVVYRAAGFKACPPSKHVDLSRYGLVIKGGRVLSDRAIIRRYGSYGAARAAGAAIVRIPARQAWQWTRARGGRSLPP